MKSAMLALLLLFIAILAALALWLYTPDRPRTALEALYLRAPADLVDLGGQRLHVRDSGPRDAPALVLLHGFGASLHTWEPWAQALAGRWRVIRFDLPGAGLSDPDATGAYTDERSMALLLALMDRLGVAQAVLVGNSIGGRLAWRFAAAQPARVRALVLISPDGFASPGFAYGRAPDVPAVAGLVQVALPRSLLRGYIAAAYADPAALTDANVRRYHDLMRAPGARAAMLARMRQTVLVDPAPLLPLIGAPVLLLWGARDAMVPLANADDYLRLLPDARLVTLPALGHVPHEEAPAQSLAPVQDFLAGLR